MTLACIKEFLIQQSFQPIFFYYRKVTHAPGGSWTPDLTLYLALTRRGGAIWAKLIGEFSIYIIEGKMYYQFYQIYFNVLASHYLLFKLFRISNKSRDLLSQANVILLKQAGPMQLFASLHLSPT